MRPGLMHLLLLVCGVHDLLSCIHYCIFRCHGRLCGCRCELLCRLLGVSLLVVGGICSEDPVHMSERRAIAVDCLFVVEVMVVCARPEGNDLVQAPREVVARMRIHRLEQPQNDPDVHSDNVQVASAQHAVRERSADRTESKDKDLEWVRVLGGETEGSAIVVVQLVDLLVKRSPVQCTVGPVCRMTIEPVKDCERGHRTYNDRSPR